MNECLSYICLFIFKTAKTMRNQKTLHKSWEGKPPLNVTENKRYMYNKSTHTDK